MPLTVQDLGDRDYAKLLGELLGRIPVQEPEWTDFNESDPGITLVELFAFIAEELLTYSDERRRRRRRTHRRRVLLGLAAVGVGGLVIWKAARVETAQAAF